MKRKLILDNYNRLQRESEKSRVKRKLLDVYYDIK